MHCLPGSRGLAAARACRAAVTLVPPSPSHRFELVLRGVEAASADAVAEAAKGLRDTGFVNYYGLQRFGTGGVPTHRQEARRQGGGPAGRGQQGGGGGASCCFAAEAPLQQHCWLPRSRLAPAFQPYCTVASTTRVGAALLRGQWREAVRMLLTPRPDCSRADQAEACRCVACCPSSPSWSL